MGITTVVACECFGSSYHVLITRQIEEHHLVPFALKGDHPSSLSSSTYFFATAFFCIYDQVEKKGWLNFHSSTLKASYKGLSFWVHLHHQSFDPLHHVYCPQILNVLKTCNLHSWIVQNPSFPHWKLTRTVQGPLLFLAVSVTNRNITIHTWAHFYQ